MIAQRLTHLKDSAKIGGCGTIHSLALVGGAGDLIKVAAQGTELGHRTPEGLEFVFR